jgi:hypothetical protein
MTQRKPEGGGNPKTNAIDTRDFSSSRQPDSVIAAMPDVAALQMRSAFHFYGTWFLSTDSLLASE